MQLTEELPCDSARRAALWRLTAGFFAVAAGCVSVASASDKDAVVCAKPDALSEAAKRQRQLDNYTEKSTDPDKSCSRCRYFTSGTGATACGKCELFNGPANPNGRCDDWTARPG